MKKKIWKKKVNDIKSFEDKKNNVLINTNNNNNNFANNINYLNYKYDINKKILIKMKFIIIIYII